MAIGPVGGNVAGGGSTREKLLWLPVSASSEGGATWLPTTTTDTIRWVTPLPNLWPGSEVKVKVIWSTGSSTTSDTVTWRVRYADVAFDSGALAGVTLSALDTTIDADNAFSTANAILRSPTGRINPAGISPDNFVLFELNANATSGIDLGGGPDNVQVYGLEVLYAPTNFSDL